MSTPHPSPSRGEVRQRIRNIEGVCLQARLDLAVQEVLELARRLYDLHTRARSGLLVLDALEGRTSEALDRARLLSLPYLRGYHMLVLAELAGRRGEVEAVREAVDELLATPRIRVHPQEYHTFGAMEAGLAWIAGHLDPSRLDALAQRMPPWFGLRLREKEGLEPRSPVPSAELTEADLMGSLARLRGEPHHRFDPIQPGQWEWDHIQLTEELLARRWSRAEDWFFLLDRTTLPYLRGRLLLRLTDCLPPAFFQEYRSRCLPGRMPPRDEAQGALRLLLALPPVRAVAAADRLSPMLQEVDRGGSLSVELIWDAAALVLHLLPASPGTSMELLGRVLDLLRPALPPTRMLYLLDRLLSRFAQETVLDERHAPMLERIADKIREIRRVGRLSGRGSRHHRGTIALLTRCSLLLYRATGLDDWTHPARVGIDQLRPMLDLLEVSDPPSGFLQGLAMSLGLPPSARDLLAMLLRGPVWPRSRLAATPTPQDLLRLAHMLPDDGRMGLRGQLVGHLLAVCRRFERDGWDEEFEVWMESVPELIWLGIEGLPQGPRPTPERLRRALPWALLNEPESIRSRLDLYRRTCFAGLGGPSVPLAAVAEVVDGVAYGSPPQDPGVWSRALVEVDETFQGLEREWLSEQLLAQTARFGVLRPTVAGFLRKARQRGDIQWLSGSLAELSLPEDLESMLVTVLEIPGWETHGWSPLMDRICASGGGDPALACRLLKAMVPHALRSPHAARNLLTAAVDAVRLGAPQAGKALDEALDFFGLAPPGPPPEGNPEDALPPTG